MKRLNKRDTYTVLCWVLFISLCVYNHIWTYNSRMGIAFSFPLNMIITMIFTKFMYMRQYFLDHPTAPRKCRFSNHDVESTTNFYMTGTNRYIDGVEIEKKVTYQSHHCTRNGCEWTD